jgi:hypothetical protein
MNISVEDFQNHETFRTQFRKCSCMLQEGIFFYHSHIGHGEICFIHVLYAVLYELLYEFCSKILKRQYHEIFDLWFFS